MQSLRMINSVSGEPSLEVSNDKKKRPKFRQSQSKLRKEKDLQRGLDRRLRYTQH